MGFIFTRAEGEAVGTLERRLREEIARRSEGRDKAGERRGTV